MTKFRNNCTIGGFGADYHKIREFLLLQGFRHYSYGRWDFMTTHAHMDLSKLDKIAIWENAGEIIGLLTYDCFNGEGGSSFCVKEGYGHIKKDMLLYAKETFAHDEMYALEILDTDTEMHEAAFEVGYVPLEECKENYVIMPIRADLLRFSLPEGFHISSLAETYDIDRLRNLFLKTFEDLGEGDHRQLTNADYERELKSPYANLDIKIVVIAPNGDFAAYCGMWYDKNADFAQVEPVGASPDYRGLGLGRAVVLEGVKRSGQLGAVTAQVDTNLQFYHNIGFRPYFTTTGWVINKSKYR